MLNATNMCAWLVCAEKRVGPIMGGFKAVNDYVHMHTNTPNMTSLISFDEGHANCLDIQNDALLFHVKTRGICR